MKGLIIEPHYYPNLQYFSKFLLTDSIILDDLSLFRKQSYRNRANILTANGILSLIVPVCKGRSKNIFKDIRIDHSVMWQKNHWNSITSAYNKSAYFQYYRHLFEGFYSKQYEFLIDLNVEIIGTITSILYLKNDFRLLTDFNGDISELTDLRNSIDPKIRHQKKDNEFIQVNYSQVFSDRFEFQPDLSIIDLIFNYGPDSLKMLHKSVSRPS